VLSPITKPKLLTSHTFDILVRKKIPFISEFLYWVAFACMIVLFIFYLVMSPGKNASEEMTTAYYILVVPEWLKEISFYAFIVLIILTPIYFRARLYKNATLTFWLNEILIEGKVIYKSLPFDSIKQVWGNDLKNSLREPKNKLQIVLRQKSGKDTTFFLKNYDLSDDFMETAMDILKEAKFSSYDSEAVAMHDDD
jgi:hypothetical protein